jgi:hypothetical protein
MATRRKTTKPVEPEVIEDDDAFEELADVDEVEEDEAPAEKPKRGRKAATTTAPAKSSTGLGSPWLAEHLTETTGKQFDARSVRMLLRRLAKDEDGPLAREVGSDRSRYEFRGPNDPVVKAIVKMVKEGPAPRTRAPKDEDEAPAPRKRAAKKAAAPVEDDEGEEEATPRRRTRKATTAPAKATPARSRRRASSE